MASTVIYPAPTTVNTTRVTYRTETVLSVSPDGQGHIVTQVSLFNAYKMFEKCANTKVLQIYIDYVIQNMVMLTECVGGRYGLNCTQQCIGHCLNNVFCNHVTGLCDGGCANGWYGLFCNETCIGHCINNATCNQGTGLCDGGCDAGWKGYTCDKGKTFTTQN